MQPIVTKQIGNSSENSQSKNAASGRGSINFEQKKGLTSNRAVNYTLLQEVLWNLDRHHPLNIHATFDNQNKLRKETDGDKNQ